MDDSPCFGDLLPARLAVVLSRLGGGHGTAIKQHLENFPHKTNSGVTKRGCFSFRGVQLNLLSFKSLSSSSSGSAERD